MNHPHPNLSPMKMPAARVAAMAHVALVALLMLACAGSALAEGRGRRDQSNRSDDRQADHRALADAVRRVERATGGEVLSAERVQSDGRDVSRVKVVDSSGRVRVYMGDGQLRDRKDDRTRRDDNGND